MYMYLMPYLRILHLHVGGQNLTIWWDESEKGAQREATAIRRLLVYLSTYPEIT